jgi:energy-coupling factor transporter ATP-binding protein EcfA2
MVTIQPGECSVIMGMKGTGKSTLQEQLAETFRERGITTVVWDPIGQYPGTVSYRPRAFDDREELDELARRVWQAAPARLEIEEAEQILPQGPDLPTTFKAFALMGRNYGLSWGVNTRRPQAVSKHVLNLADHLFIFKLELRDLDYMKSFLGRAGTDLEDMRTWTKDPREGGGQFFHYHDGQLEQHPPLDLA